jgi:hypothetical protein
MARIPALLPVLAAVACSNFPASSWDTGFKGDADADADADADGDTDQESGDADTDSDSDTESGGPDTAGAGQFDEPGDYATWDDTSGRVEVDLTDASGDSNKDQEFYLVVVNSAESDIGYELRYTNGKIEGNDTGDTGSAGPPAPHARPRATSIASSLVLDPTPEHALAPPPSAELSDADVGVTEREFRVRADIGEDDVYDTVLAKVWAVGTNVAIWVDEDVPIDWDTDCDGNVDEPAEFDAYGFDNCDLDTVATIIDENIVPNITAIYGEIGDFDEDGKVAVLITPVLNRITLTSEDEDDFAAVLPSYAEPAVDLNAFDYRSNPGSDEGEVVYLYAPDPYGYFNPYAPTGIDDYTSFNLAAEVARSYTTIVTYHWKVQVNGGGVEEDWLNDGLGTFAADYCGFGAPYHDDAWDYLDAPWQYSLLSEGAKGSLATLARGAQYLFVLWLYQAAEADTSGSGITLLNAIVQGESTGIEAITDATDVSEFADLVVGWQVALLATGYDNADGSAPLVDPSVWPQYSDAEIISADPSAPGGYYGANGYQRGLNIKGENWSYTGGHTSSPEVASDSLVTLQNADYFIYSAGFSFSGFVAKNYGAQTVRLTGIPYDEAVLELQETDEGLVGAVVRWTDPVTPDYTAENIYSATSADTLTLPALPTDGTDIHGVGEITEGATTQSIDADGVGTTADVADTDRWSLDLTDRDADEMVHLAIWLDRHYTATDGSLGPEDPWVAIVPSDFVPQPTTAGTRDSSACADDPEFAFPISILEYLYFQVFLSSEMYTENDGFDACGSTSLDSADTGLTCAADWDGDTISNDDEPRPTNFYEQVLVQQCTLNGGEAPDSPYDLDWMDADELDEDTTASFSYAYNIGGVTGDDGEEGFLEVWVPGGATYTIIVGATGVGGYEFAVRELLD